MKLSTAIIAVQFAVIAALLLHGDTLEAFGMGLVLGLSLGAPVGAAFALGRKEQNDVPS